MKLSHFSKTPVTGLTDVKCQPTHDAIKPQGLWLSVDGERDWEEWCKAESFRLEHTKFRQEITLQPDVLQPIVGGVDSGVLHLYSPFCLDQFTNRFASRNELFKANELAWIDWVQVANVYDGLIISPYIWERRMSLIWYYGWDCASGCIWRPSKVIAQVGPAVPVDWLDTVTQ